MTNTPHSQTPTRSLGTEQRAAYRLEVQGTIGISWAAWFEGTTIKQQEDIIIVETVVDQSALRGLLCRLWDLNLSVVSVNRVEADALATGGISHDE